MVAKFWRTNVFSKAYFNLTLMQQLLCSFILRIWVKSNLTGSKNSRK